MTSRELLERFKPQLIYDTQESYFADSAAICTDIPGNQLRRADRRTVIAAATPKQGQEQLSLELLSAGRYSDSSHEYRKGDYISCPSGDYAAVYRAIRGGAGYRNVVYGRAFSDGGRPRWLQYWLYYFYNPAPARQLGVGYGAHEGDWEMIQLRLGDDGRPDMAAYAQHKGAEMRGWRDVEKTGAGDTPVVYVARASHASYFKRVHLPWERADGGLRAPPLALVELTETTPPWVGWRGAWGDTKPDEVLGVAVGQPSPGGPVAHEQWHDPAKLRRSREAPPVLLEPMPPAPETLTVSRDDDHAAIAYAFAGGDRGTATALLITVSSPDDKYPPVTDTVPISAATGAVIAPPELDPAQRYAVHVSAVNDQGATSEVLTRQLPPQW